ncbi:MAG: hypothetical protein JEZ01_04440 [Labilibaculum sp.]|nr:hypothetical protein [Labilibaculum sp.]MBI9057001.1 hypothetical protein [Labilibaculum sp.]
MKIYNYLFFKIYQILSVFDESPTFATIIVMCWLFLFNIFTLFDLLLQMKTVSELLGNITPLPFITVILASHLIYFYRKQKYIIVLDRFIKEGKYSNIFGTIGVVLYIFLSIWVFFKFTVPYIGGILK